MDFFDVRKFQTSHRDFVINDGRLHVVSDYSLIALLPVILVALLITTIFCVYRFRRWKHNKKQLAELNAFYEIVESSPCLSSGKPYLIQHCSDIEKSECDRITRAVCVPTQSSIFFQPIPPKAKTVRCNGEVLKAVNASEVIFHFAQLPEIEKTNNNNNNNKKSLHFVHRV
ncbi:Protein CBG06136 [Caenorhabditis briggsae]|uniref:Protein CBG06136 n=1 Tax=Caenorhabditis briggsae TaxID=6238 RepID=A8X0U2_CAEBR|nr:Protein CBG06136 [Caenorhabditis briggsae]CAP26252.2 Protein CBG06136 [Caenorhabditis briggsae]